MHGLICVNNITNCVTVYYRLTCLTEPVPTTLRLNGVHYCDLIPQVVSLSNFVHKYNMCFPRTRERKKRNAKQLKDWPNLSDMNTYQEAYPSHYYTPN